VTSDVCLQFPAKEFLYLFLYVISQWEIIFQQTKITQTHLLMSIGSIKNMAVDLF